MSEEFIFELQPNKQDILDTEYYTIAGQEDYLDSQGYPRTNTDNEKVVAKKTVKHGSNPKYSIKIDINNKLSNPTSIYGNREKISSFLDTVCRANNRFIDVNLKTFNLYLNFLKTKNKA